MTDLNRHFVEAILIGCFVKIGMDTPDNFQDILKYCSTVVNKRCHDRKVSVDDVIIAFRQWIEAK